MWSIFIASIVSSWFHKETPGSTNQYMGVIYGSGFMLMSIAYAVVGAIFYKKLSHATVLTLSGCRKRILVWIIVISSFFFVRGLFNAIRYHVGCIDFWTSVSSLNTHPWFFSLFNLFYFIILEGIPCMVQIHSLKYVISDNINPRNASMHIFRRRNNLVRTHFSQTCSLSDKL